MKRYNVAIDKKEFDELKVYAVNNGLKLRWIVSAAIKLFLKKEGKLWTSMKKS